ncbi:ABC transporter ATP-binding protein [Cytobacillus pseudoceanisediminis]|uniref:ABC transporter ATP-binding protein n=1 Tax=Cytobacillus pseudoceanisediminis TaxID=3051614 RepID=UPI003C2DA931
MKLTRINLPFRDYYNLLKKYIRPYRMKLNIIFFLLIVSIALSLISPQILRFYIDTAQLEGTSAVLVVAAVLFISVVLLNKLSDIVLTYLGEDVGLLTTNTLRKDLLEHCLNLDTSFYHHHTPGEMIERIENDVNILANFFSKFTLILLSNTLLLFGILFILLYENLLLGFSLSLFSFLAIGLLYKISSIAVPYWKNVSEENATLFGFIGEHINGVEDIRANGSIGYVKNRFYSLLRSLLRPVIKAQIAGSAIYTSSVLIFSAGMVVTFGIAAYLWGMGSLTVGTVYMIFFYSGLLRKPIVNIQNQIDDLQKVTASIIRINELLNESSAISKGSGVRLDKGPLSIKFNNITFSYNGENQIFQEFNLEVGKGKTLCVLGRTGSGKTTLVRLLLRMYEPQNGEIIIDGKKLKDLGTNDLRQKIALVTQDVQILSSTIRNNITLFNPEIQDELIIKASKELGFDNWLNELPEGLDTKVDSDGSGLSAGEAQMLVLIRLFLLDPSVIVFDESTSRLDRITEQKVEDAIKILLQNRTGIIISHRLNIVNIADEVLILGGQGEILEIGSHEELMKNPNSEFNHLLKTGKEVGIE